MQFFKVPLVGLLLSLAAVSWAGLVEEHLTDNQGFNCGTDTDIFKVSKFVITPWPITKNASLKLEMTGTMSQTEVVKELYVNVLFSNQPFYHQSLPLTSEEVEANTSYTAKQQAFLPGFAPSGVYGVQVKLESESELILNCWQVNFQI